MRRGRVEWSWFVVMDILTPSIELVSRSQYQYRSFSLSVPSSRSSPSCPICTPLHRRAARLAFSPLWQPDVVSSQVIVIGGDLEAAMLIRRALID